MSRGYPDGYMETMLYESEKVEGLKPILYLWKQSLAPLFRSVLNFIHIEFESNISLLM